MCPKEVHEEDRKRAISFSLSTNDKKMIQRVQEMYHLNSNAEAIMFCVKHAAAGRIAMPGQNIVSSVDGTAVEQARQKIALPSEGRPAGLGLTAPGEKK